MNDGYRATSVLAPKRDEKQTGKYFCWCTHNGSVEGCIVDEDFIGAVRNARFKKLLTGDEERLSLDALMETYGEQKNSILGESEK